MLKTTKLTLIGSTLIIAGMFMVASNAEAASHKHLNKLAACHITQVDEANGVTCASKAKAPAKSLPQCSVDAPNWARGKICRS